MDLNYYRNRASSLFKLNVGFLKELFQHKGLNEILSGVIKFLTPEQMELLILLIFFIHKKEIPLFVSEVKHFPENFLDKLSEDISIDKLKDLLICDREQKLKFLEPFTNYFPFLVKPILFRH